jgi:hypothetical protein
MIVAILFKLCRAPRTDRGEYEGANYDQWFSSWVELLKVRRQMIRDEVAYERNRKAEQSCPSTSEYQQGPYSGDDFEVWEYELKRLAPRAMAVACLNYGDFYKSKRIAFTAARFRDGELITKGADKTRGIVRARPRKNVIGHGYVHHLGEKT